MCVINTICIDLCQDGNIIVKSREYLIINYIEQIVLVIQLSLDILTSLIIIKIK